MGRGDAAKPAGDEVGNYHGGQLSGVFAAEFEGNRHEQPAERGERLRVAQHFLALVRIGEQLG